MSLETSIDKREKALISTLQEKQSAIDDRTGKGLATENLIEESLIRPFLPPKFGCTKGAVVTSESPGKQSPAIDRIIFDRTMAFPLIYDPAHSVFPIESVCGLVEITMKLDKGKLQADIERMAPIKAMTTRRYLVPVPGMTTKAFALEQRDMSPRSYIIGFPKAMNWNPKTIGTALSDVQRSLGPPTHVHGLYVIGVGFFQTVPIENGGGPMYRIRFWTGPDRLFRFAESFRQSFDRWPVIPDGWTVDLSGYVKSDSEMIVD